MKTLLSLLFIFSFAVVGFAQNNTIRWKAGEPCCDEMMKDGELFIGFETEDFMLAVTFNDTAKDYYLVWANVINKSGKRITVQPSDFTLHITAPADQRLAALDSDNLADKIRNKGKWKDALNRAGAGMSRKQSSATVEDGYGNTAATVRVDERDDERAAQVERKIEQRENNRQSRAAVVADSALLGNTIFQGQNVKGYIYFPKKKTASGSILEVTINGTVYEIPFGAERK